MQLPPASPYVCRTSRLCPQFRGPQKAFLNLRMLLRARLLLSHLSLGVFQDDTRRLRVFKICLGLQPLCPVPFR